MTKAETQLVEIDIDDLLKADWNYKTDGTPDEIEMLAESIREDRSAGVMAVREMLVNDKIKFEVIDGNHRLDAVALVGWEKVPCENFGRISKAKAITIARRRNHQWFKDDVLKYAELFKNEVLQEFSLEQLEKFMPDSREEMENFSKLLEFDWDSFNGNGNTDDETNQNGIKTIALKVPEETYNIWLKWKERCEAYLDYDNDAKCFEFAIVEALNIPKESLK